MVAFGRFVSTFFVELLVIDFTLAYSLRFVWVAIEQLHALLRVLFNIKL